MPGAQELRPLISLIDRLVDDAPSNSAEPQMSRSEAVRVLKNSVKRDLEWLLNTRRIAFEPPESLKEVNRSLYVFGLPDLSSFSLAAEKERTRLLRVLQSAVRLFEPRLANVRVVPVHTAEVGRSRLWFRIEALLRMDPAPERISFDTVLDLANGGYRIQGEPDAG